MDQIKKIELKLIDQHTSEYEVLVYLNDHLYEFSNEFGTSNEEKEDLTLQVKKK